jgi:hypothetical protein
MASPDQNLEQQKPQVAKCYLLTIPPEILDSILKSLLVKRDRWNASVERVTKSEGGFEIANTCKHLHTESNRIYFSHNKFKFTRLDYSKTPFPTKMYI